MVTTWLSREAAVSQTGGSALNVWNLNYLTPLLEQVEHLHILKPQHPRDAGRNLHGLLQHSLGRQTAPLSPQSTSEKHIRETVQIQGEEPKRGKTLGSFIMVFGVLPTLL